MKIPRQQRPTPYLNRRDQLRMLVMVGVLCLVMVAIKLAAIPSSWYWLLPPQGEQVSVVGEGSRGAVSLKELDFRVQDDRELLPPDVFRAVAALDEQPTVEETANDTSVETLTPDIDPDWLAPIKDNTIGVRSAESAVYREMLERIRRLPEEVVRASADEDVAFTVIMLHSEDYRGQLVTITGQLHRLTPIPHHENDGEQGDGYEGWVFTNDSGNNPWRFVCTQLPAGAELGDAIAPVKIALTGYFFKRTGYASQGGLHVAPTLLAKTFEILPVAVNHAPAVQSEMQNWLLGVIVAIAVGVALLMWRFLVDDRKYAKSRARELAAARLDALPGDLEALKQVETVDAATMFVEGVESSVDDGV